MQSILPEDAQGEIPVGFAIVGHVGASEMYRSIANLLIRSSTLEFEG